MTRKQLQRFYRLGLAALIGSSVLFAETAQAQQQPINRNTPAAQQQIQQQQPINQAAAPGAQQQAPVAPAPVAPFPTLDPQQQKYLDDFLGYWSQQTANIQRYRSDFQRWTYEGKEQHTRYAKGVLRFQSPDKGMFRVDNLYFHKGVNPDGTPDFKLVDGQFGEWWICDGKILHEFDRTQKKVTRFYLPPELQGAALINSPLPFLFGVDAAKAKARYWLRPLAPPAGPDGKPRTDIHQIEAFPKTMADAQNYSRVIVTLDSKEFLPLGLKIYLPNWTPQNNAVEVFEFANREKNWNFLKDAMDRLKFEEEFLPLNPPKDWTIEEEKADAVGGQPQDRAANQPAPNNAPRR